MTGIVEVLGNLWDEVTRLWRRFAFRLGLRREPLSYWDLNDAEKRAFVTELLTEMGRSLGLTPTRNGQHRDESDDESPSTTAQ